MSSNQPTKQTPRKRVVPPLSSNPNPKASSSNPNQANQAAAAAAPTVTSSNPNPKTSSSSTAAAASNPNPKTSSSNPNHNSSTAAAQTLSKTSSSSTAAAASNPNPKTSSSSTTAAAPTPSKNTKLNPLISSTSTTALQPSSWGECSWSVKAKPAEAIIPSNKPYLFCRMQEESAGVLPKDDIYEQPPSELLMNRRANLQDGSYLIHSKRHVHRNGTVQRGIRNSAAKWMAKGNKMSVSGKDGETAGSMTPLVLFSKNARGAWTADEYVSVKCKDSTSAMVVLKCSDDSWIDAEKKLLVAEAKLAECYQKLLLAKEEGEKAKEKGEKAKEKGEKAKEKGAKQEDKAKSRVQQWETAVSHYKGNISSAIQLIASERSMLRDKENLFCECVPTIPVLVGEENAPAVVEENVDGGDDFIDSFVAARKARGKAKV